MNERWRIGFLLALVTVVYANSLGNQFTLDDELYITGNPQVTRFSWPGLLAPNRTTNVFRPLSFLTFAFNWAIGPHPFGFHVLNLLLHAAVVVLLYFLFRALLRDNAYGPTIALVAAALFAVHPIHTEAVTSIVGRPELLATGFLFTAWLLHLHDRQILALLCFALALLSKESAAVLLPLVLVGDYALGKWKPLPRYAGIATLTAIYLGLLWRVQGGRFGQRVISPLDNPLGNLPAPWRILNAVRVAWKYLALQLYPHVLSCDYSFNEIPIFKDWRHTLPAAIAAAAVVGLWLWAIARRKGEWILAGGIYFAGFTTTSNILIPTGTILGERLAYLPSAGICLLAAAVWARLFAEAERKDQQKWAVAVLAAVVALLGARSIFRNRDWKDNETLFASAIRAVPNSAKAHNNLGLLYLNERQQDRAQREFETVLRIYPGYPDTLASYGLLNFQRGDYKDAQWMMQQALDTSTRDDPNYDFMAVNLAGLWMQTGDNFDAIDLLNREISESPGYARAWANRAVIRYRLGQPAAARADAEAALRLDRNNPQVLQLMQQLNSSAAADQTN